MKKVAINIKTESLYPIISSLRKDGWIVTAKYYGFDAGIDDDYWCLRKGFKKIEFGWSNWTEGEIKTTNEVFKQLEMRFKIKFEYGEPSNLKKSVISTYKLQSMPLWIVKKLKLLE